jgi:WD40 repeat protein
MSVSRPKLYACSPTTARGVQVHLTGDPQGKECIAYANGKTVIVRNLASLISAEYTEHTCNVNSVRWSPNGTYIASGDVKGNIRVWDTTRILQNISSTINGIYSIEDNTALQPKLQNRYLNGKINDLAWDAKSARLIIVGDSNVKYIHAVSLDTGSSLGDFIGHHKAVLACDLYPNSGLFRAITASEDRNVNVYDGVPFRFRKSIHSHHGFVYDCRFSRNGIYFATCGADYRILIYENSSLEQVSELKCGENTTAHAGSVFGIYWNEENSQLVSVSADRMVRLWDIETSKSLCSFEMGSKGDILSQQMGCLWQGDYIVSLSLSGALHLFDPRKPNRPSRSIYVGRHSYVNLQFIIIVF